MSYQFGAAQDVFAQAATIVLVTPVVPSEAPTAKVLQGLFEPGASARVAGSIGEGRTVDAIATALGLSRETIRSQLKALLSKPDASRRLELVGLLTSIRQIQAISAASLPPSGG
jgi:hypothetical protein